MTMACPHLFKSSWRFSCLSSSIIRSCFHNKSQDLSNDMPSLPTKLSEFWCHSTQLKHHFFLILLFYSKSFKFRTNGTWSLHQHTITWYCSSQLKSIMVNQFSWAFFSSFFFLFSFFFSRFAKKNQLISNLNTEFSSASSLFTVVD